MNLIGIGELSDFKDIRKLMNFSGIIMRTFDISIFQETSDCKSRPTIDRLRCRAIVVKVIDRVSSVALPPSDTFVTLD